MSPQIDSIFIDNPKSDVILRSADNVDFRFSKFLLSLSSSFFETMFELPQSQNEAGSDSVKDGLPLISLKEESKTVEKLLLSCCPITAKGLLDIATLEDVQRLLEAAIKYDMEGLEKHVRRALVAPHFGEKDPMRVFAIACRYKLDEEVQIAAKYTLRLPILQRPYVPELEYITGGHIQRVEEYYGRCVDAAKAVAGNLKWLSRDSFVWFGRSCRNTSCPCAPGFVEVGMHRHSTLVQKWWFDYLQSTTVALSLQPYGEVVKRSDLMDTALREACDCEVCGSRAFRELREFAELYAKEIDRVVSEVRTCGLDVPSDHADGRHLGQGRYSILKTHEQNCGILMEARRMGNL
jgi:hypothetical protein